MSTILSPIEHVFQRYTPPPGTYDEFLQPDRQPRPLLEKFLNAMAHLPAEEFSRRWSQAQRTVEENGFAHSGYVTPSDELRPWNLDPLPLLIPSEEWKTISAAIEQRGQLLNLILRDLYGPQELLKLGILPPEALYAHPGYLRAYRGLLPDSRNLLQFYAADLGRSPDGRWWILADRTEAPSGIGFALENRIVISRMLPDVFHQCQVHRLAPFFSTLQSELRSQAPWHRENPHVVVLSQGPTGPNYFENSFLARYLGYTLVEGEDLAVRNCQVNLKTLGGLTPVDVILRRQNSHQCDPLELHPHSGLGIAGLTQAVRSQNVGVANNLGSGLVESAAFMSFMPRLCEHLLGTNLILPGVASWWCGQPDGLDYVLKNLDRLVMQPAFRNRGGDGPTRESLQKMSRNELIKKIRRNPSRFAAQEKVQRSTMPVGSDFTQPAHLALRVYAVSHNQSWSVMPGALARTSRTVDPLELSIRKGEGSKDVWVLADQPVDRVTLLNQQGDSVSLKRSGADLPSRVADNFFWLGRQLERADASARLLRSVVQRLSGETRSTILPEMPVLLRCLADAGQIETGYAVADMRARLAPIEDALPDMVFDTSNPGCLRTVLSSMLRLGSVVRDRISLDTWRTIHRIEETFRPSADGTLQLADLLKITDDLITELAAFSGIVMESMTRGPTFRFLELGRRLERALQIVSMVKNCFIPLPDPPGPVLEAVLEMADSLMTYRARYLAKLRVGAVLDLLLTDDTNPRSLAFQLIQLSEQVEHLPRDAGQPGLAVEQRLAQTLLHSNQMLDISLLAESVMLKQNPHLEKLVAEWESQIPNLAEAISHRYFVHADLSHQLTDILP